MIVLNRIKELRKEKHMTQKHIAEMLNISQNTYSQYESGKREIKVSVLIDLSRIFNVSLSFLLEESDIRSMSTVNNTDILSKRLKELRIRRGYKQKEIAKFLGITQGNYARFGTETGHILPRITHLEKIAKIFNVSLSYLLGEGSAPTLELPHQPNPKTLPERLEFLRKRAGLSQTEISKNLGLSSRQTYSNYERGVNKPQKETLEKLAEFFNVSVDYLLCKTDDQRSNNSK